MKHSDDVYERLKFLLGDEPNEDLFAKKDYAGAASDFEEALRRAPDRDYARQRLEEARRAAK